MSALFGAKFPYQPRNNSQTTNTIAPFEKISRTIGNVDMLIEFNPNTTYKLEKAIEPIVAERLTKLGKVNEIFTFEIYDHPSIISDFSDAASLKDVLNLKKYCKFTLKHCKILMTDVIAGISALHEVGLQRNKFSLEDVLLVWQRDIFYFQIAGIENCTCIDGEPTNDLELKSFRDIILYVKNVLENEERFWVENLERSLDGREALDSAALKEAKKCVSEKILLSERKLLERYMRAVRVLVPLVGELKPDKHVQLLSQLSPFLH